MHPALVLGLKVFLGTLGGLLLLFGIVHVLLTRQAKAEIENSDEEVGE